MPFDLIHVQPTVDCPGGFETGYDSCYHFLTNSSLFTDYEGANASCALMTNYTGHLLYAEDQTELVSVSWKLKTMEVDVAKAFHTGM